MAGKRQLGHKKWDARNASHFFIYLALKKNRTTAGAELDLAGLHKLVAKHSSQSEQAGAEEAQCAGLRNT
jgi:hypothetical protein